MRVDLSHKGRGEKNTIYLKDFEQVLRAIQLCVDMAGIIITENKWGIPKTLAESFEILKNNNIIDQSLCQKMCKMLGFRNIATHAYKEINYSIVKIIVDQYLVHFENFYSQILK